MGKYAQALGLWEFEIKDMKFSLKPTKGDNLKFLRIQQVAGKDSIKLINDFVPFMTEIIARNDDIPRNDPSYAELEAFVEYNAMALLRETMIGFGWVTRERWEETEASQGKNFQENLSELTK